LGKTIWDKIEVLLGTPLGTTWETSRELDENKLRTNREQGKKPKNNSLKNPL
jgi:hypothetical protein